MTDASGTVVWAADYKPFGEANITTSTVTNNFRFPGQYFDHETSLYYNYFRDYNPSVGRYIQSDPIGLMGGVNLFAYVKNSPVNFFDPLGLFVATVNYGGGQYNSVTMVWNSWLPSFYTSGSIGNNGSTIQSGIYNYQYGQHPMTPNGKTPYPALNLYARSGDRCIPGTKVVNGKTVNAPVCGVNVHKGYKPKSGSQGCHVIPKDNWDDFISNFEPGDNGTYVYINLF